MKQLAAAVVLSLLMLSLPREGATTHLETCNCHEITDVVNATVQEAIAGLEDKLNILITKSSEKTSTELESTLSATIKSALQPIQAQLDYHLPSPPSGATEDTPVASCKALKQINSNAYSDYYWVKAHEDSVAVRVYCNMSLTCGSLTGGWMKVADLDMRDTSQSCPSGFTYTSSPKRLCDITSTGCVGEEYSVHGIEYNHVCGKVIGYQHRVPIAYHFAYESSYLHYNNINQPYVWSESNSWQCESSLSYLDICWFF